MTPISSCAKWLTHQTAEAIIVAMVLVTLVRWLP